MRGNNASPFIKIKSSHRMFPLLTLSVSLDSDSSSYSYPDRFQRNQPNQTYEGLKR